MIRSLSMCSALCSAVLLSVVATAQAPERVPVAPVGQANGSQVAEAVRPNTSVVTIPGPTNTAIDDEPDFTPTRRVADGAADVTVDRVGDPYMLSFLGGDYRPARGFDPRLLAAMVNNPTGHTYGYIMIEGRLNHPAKVARLEANGIVIYAPHTWQSFVAKIPFQSLVALRDMPFVRWVGYAQPGQKIEPRLAAQLALAQPQGARFKVHVSTFASDLNPASVRRPIGSSTPSRSGDRAIEMPIEEVTPNGPFQKALEGEGFELKHYCDTGNVYVFQGTATAAQIQRLQDLDFVSYIELEPKHELFHDQSQAMIGADRVRGTYHGQPITVGHIDSGIDSTPWHNDFSGKSFVGWNTNATTAFEDGCEHGSHVCGTIFGGGIADAKYRGTAPNCGNGGAGYRVFIGRYFFDACDPQGSVDALYNAFAGGYVEGAITNLKPRVVNNSWGAAPGTMWSGTEAGARTLDDVIQNNLECYVFASGNTGGGCGSPGSAKNALTVGSLDDFGTNAGRLSSFSRSGVSDSRQKPEVCAPGYDITSVDAGTTTGYRNSSGTSMAAPHVTGALTGVIHHYSFLDYSPPAQQVVAIACSDVQGATTMTATQGWGCINAYKMHWTSRTGWTVITNHTYIDATGKWFYADVAVPSGLASLDVVWGWTEPAASSGATVARRSSIRITLDAPPYDPAGNVGEYTAFLGSNVKWRVASIPVATFSGQTVRVKLYGDSVSGLCRVSGLLFYHYNNSTTPEPTLSISKSASNVKPSTSFTMTGAWTAAATGDEFDNSRIWPVVPSFAITQLQRTTADGISQVYTGTSHTSYPWPALNGNGITTGQGTSRSAVWTLTSPATNGTYALQVSGQADYRSTATASASTTICVDGQIPNAPTGLTSSTHTTSVWSSNPNVTFNWTPGADVGCAGVASQQYVLSNSSCGTPVTSTGAATSSLPYSGLAPTTAATGYYFAVRSIDASANVGSSSCTGPYLIDNVNPAVTSVSINAAATHTTTLNVSVATSATDAHSGVFEIRMSSDNTTFSAWQPFGSPLAYDLSTNGGNTNEGTKAVYVQVRDRAGNISASGSDTIEYLRLPVLGSSAPASLPNVTENAFRITGTDMVGITEVLFDATSLTSTSANNWHTGYFRVINDVTLDVYPPQALLTGGHTIRARNAAGLSNTLNVSLTFPATAVLRSHKNLTAGLPTQIFTSSGPGAGAYTTYVILSRSGVPSVLPGIVSLAIGNAFTDITIIGPYAHNVGTRAATTGLLPTVPPMVGTSLYFQALTYSVLAFPVPTTDAWRSDYL